jgi:hypothetical protein
MRCWPMPDEGAGFARLAADPGRVGLESLLAEIAKLERLRGLGLPPDLLRGAHPEQIKRFRRRAAIETAWELRRHAPDLGPREPLRPLRTRHGQPHSGPHLTSNGG